MSERAAGNIYDLGYRRYEGERLGRRHAVFTLYLHNLRASFGLGRRAVSKIFPFAFAIIAFIPALIQLGVGALTNEFDADVELFAHHDYYGFIEIILVLFAATVAPELGGRDQRTRTLSLYFSRALRRGDYALAKFAALTTALLALTLGPQVVLYIGNGLTQDDVWGYLRDEWDLVLPILTSAILMSAIIAAVSLAVASRLPRRAYSTVAVLAIYIIPTTVVAILVETADIDVTRWTLLISPWIFEAGTLWMFGEPYDPGNTYGRADLHGSLYVIAGVVWLGIGLALLVDRFRKVTA